MPPKCIETTCQREGKHKITTLDNLTLYVCEEHLNSWIKSGCLVSEKLTRTIKTKFLGFGVPSLLFVLGFSLMIHVIIGWTDQYQISIYSPELWLGLVFMVISWVISMIFLRNTYQKVKTYTIK